MFTLLAEALVKRPPRGVAPPFPAVDIAPVNHRRRTGGGGKFVILRKQEFFPLLFKHSGFQELFPGLTRAGFLFPDSESSGAQLDPART